jgi:hypothetical protein
MIARHSPAVMTLALRCTVAGLNLGSKARKDRDVKVRSSVCVVTRLQSIRLYNRRSIPGSRSKRSAPRPALGLYPMGTGDYFLRGKAAVDEYD